MNTPADRAARIDRVSLTVPDLEAAERFYGDALHFVPVKRTARDTSGLADLLGVPGTVISSVLMRLGAQHLELLAFDPPGAPYPLDSTSSDLWFQHCAIVVSDMAVAHALLQTFAITPITNGGPQTLPPNTGSVTAFKFRDPDGHPLELLRFPLGVGDACWHKPGSKPLFQGIDHTAIAVSDADRSTTFYRDRLGFEPTSRSANAGPEQSALDAVEHDRVDVVALAPAKSPPHLELLGYRTGRRRARPDGWRPRDVAATRTFIEVPSLDRASVRLDDHVGGPWRKGTWEQGRALCGIDPDGHSLILSGDAAALRLKGK